MTKYHLQGFVFGLLAIVSIFAFPSVADAKVVEGKCIAWETTEEGIAGWSLPDAASGNWAIDATNIETMTTYVLFWGSDCFMGGPGWCAPMEDLPDSPILDETANPKVLLKAGTTIEQWMEYCSANLAAPSPPSGPAESAEGVIASIVASFWENSGTLLQIMQVLIGVSLIWLAIYRMIKRLRD